MNYCHRHNLSHPLADDEMKFGIRVSLKPGDPFNRLVDQDWERLHWYPTQQSRDEALEDMQEQHLYSRDGDRPSLTFASIER